jgi:hypothetical protein
MDHGGPLKKSYFSRNQRVLLCQGGTTQMERLICFPPWGLGKEEMARKAKGGRGSKKRGSPEGLPLFLTFVWRNCLLVSSLPQARF